ncbi:MAG: hypothetical protein RLZZ77_1964, partial [Bacteroidota bacterium]
IKKAPIKKAPVKKAPAKKVVAKPAPAKKAPAKKAPVKAAPVKAAPTKKVVAKPAPVVAKKAEPKKPAPAVKAEIKKTAPAKVDPKKVVVEKPAAAAKPEVKKPEVKKAEAKPAPTAKVEAPKADTPKVEAPKAKAAPAKAPQAEAPKVVEPPKPVLPPQPKPVANPIYVPPGPDGKPGVKYAPIAIINRPQEKEKPKQEVIEDMASKPSPRLAFIEGEESKKGITVEDKLRALYDIQLIDSRIDKIRSMRGELPLEVEDLEDEVAGLDTRIEKFNEEVNGLDTEIAEKKQSIKDAEAAIKKYKEQLEKVKNNREFESLNKEIEFQELEIQLFKKRIKEYESSREQKGAILDASKIKLEERRNDLRVKRQELDEIIAETQKEETFLRAKSDEAKKLIEQRLVDAYERIRGGAPNGLAVVPIEREASAGSFIQIPPQKQMDVAARKKVIVDEHSGRILVDADLAREEQEKIEKLLAIELGKA